MKRTRNVILFVVVSMIVNLSANMVLASKTKHQEQIKEIAIQLTAMGLTAAVLNWGANKAGLQGSSKAALQLTNGLIQVGYHFGKPAVTDLGMQLGLASAAVNLASSALLAKKLMPSLPIVGRNFAGSDEEGEKGGGKLAAATLTLPLYLMANALYDILLEKFPHLKHFVKTE